MTFDSNTNKNKLHSKVTILLLRLPGVCIMIQNYGLIQTDLIQLDTLMRREKLSRVHTWYLLGLVRSSIFSYCCMKLCHWKSHWKSRITLKILGTKEMGTVTLNFFSVILNFPVWFQCPWTTKENISVWLSMLFPLYIFSVWFPYFFQCKRICVIFSVIVS